MGCCSTAEPTNQLQFHGMDLYESELSNKNSKNRANKSTDPSEHANTERVISEISSDRSLKYTNNSQPLPTNPRTQESEDGDLLLSQTWPTLQPNLAQNQRQSRTQGAQKGGMVKKVMFNEPPVPPKDPRVINYSLNAQLRVRFGPLTTINQQESQMAETVKLSEMGSRAELNIANKSNFQD